MKIRQNMGTYSLPLYMTFEIPGVCAGDASLPPPSTNPLMSSFKCHRTQRTGQREFLHHPFSIPPPGVLVARHGSPLPPSSAGPSPIPQHPRQPSTQDTVVGARNQQSISYYTFFPSSLSCMLNAPFHTWKMLPTLPRVPICFFPMPFQAPNPCKSSRDR